MRPFVIISFALGLAAPPPLDAQTSNTQPGSSQAMDATFAQHAKEWTTKPEFISSLVDHLPTSSTVPSPRDVLGHDIGAPRKLDYYADLLKFYRTLAEKSPHVKIVETGKTEEGRPTVVVLISSEANISGLETNR